MDLINELAFFLSQKPPKEFDTFLPKSSKIRKLYELVVIDDVKTDQEAAKTIYNTTKADKKYLMLKRNLVQKLSDMVFLADHVDISEDNYAVIQFTVEKELSIAEKLLSENVYHNPSKIISRVEQTAEKFYLIDLQVSAAQKFRSIYSLKGYPTETEQYDNKVKQLRRFQNYFNEAKGMWEIIYSKTKYTIAKLPEFAFEAAQFTEAIEPWIREYESPFLKLFYLRINILKYEQQNNFDKLLLTINNLHILLKQYNYLQTKALYLELNLNYTKYYRYIGNVDIADFYVNECLQFSDYRAFNKFLVQEYNFDINIKKGNYEKALEILNEVWNVPQFKFLNENDLSAWYIREAYLHFVLFVHDFKEYISKLPNLNQGIDINSFLENTKKSSKDKYGYNIQLLIIRLLFLFNKNSKNIDSEGNNLSIYLHRYLKDINSERTKIFFRALGKIASQGFDPDYIEEREKKMNKRLTDLGTINYDIFEIIPYEDFWEMLKLYTKQIRKSI
jgi:hypothetical protein